MYIQKATFANTIGNAILLLHPFQNKDEYYSTEPVHIIKYFNLCVISMYREWLLSYFFTIIPINVLKPTYTTKESKCLQINHLKASTNIHILNKKLKILNGYENIDPNIYFIKIVCSAIKIHCINFIKQVHWFSKPRMTEQVRNT